MAQNDPEVARRWSGAAENVYGLPRGSIASGEPRESSIPGVREFLAREWVNPEAAVGAIHQYQENEQRGDAIPVVPCDDAAIERVAREVCIVKPGENSREQAERYLRAARETP